MHIGMCMYIEPVGCRVTLLIFKHLLTILNIQANERASKQYTASMPVCAKHFVTSMYSYIHKKKPCAHSHTHTDTQHVVRGVWNTHSYLKRL